MKISAIKHGVKGAVREAANIRRLMIGLFFLVGIFLTGCGGGQTPAQVAGAPLPHAKTQDPPPGAILLSTSTGAADALAAQALLRMGSSSGVVTSSMVNLENLDQSSLLGQTVMQQIGSRLSQHGYKVLESRLAAELRMDKTKGEFMLTRESAALLARDHDAHAALVGVYSESGNRIFMSVRLVRLNDNAVIAAYEYYLPKNNDVLSLMAASKNRPASGSSVWHEKAKREQAFEK